MAKNWHTLADRLQWAIDLQPSNGRERGLRLFQRRMVQYAGTAQYAGTITGTSLSQIQVYLRGKDEPSLAFIGLAARILSVREAWLAWGSGAPTEAQEVASRDLPEVELFRISNAVYRALGVPTELPAGSSPRAKPKHSVATARDRFWGSAEWARVVRQTALLLYQRRPMWETFSRGRDSELGKPFDKDAADAAWGRALEDIATALAAPLRGLGVDASYLNLQDVADYVQAIALAIHRVTFQYWPEREPRADTRSVSEPHGVTAVAKPRGHKRKPSKRSRGKVRPGS